MTTLRPLPLVAQDCVRFMHERLRISTSPPAWANYGYELARAIARSDYGLESPDMVLARLISRLSSWRGPDAARLKAELNDHLQRMNEDPSAIRAALQRSSNNAY